MSRRNDIIMIKVSDKSVKPKFIEYAVWIIILFGALIRMVNIQMPLLEGVATRQIYNAMVTKYFYLHNMNFLYPFMEIRGNAPYVQALEAPVIPFIAAALYHVFGGVHTEILRLISVCSIALASLFLYRLVIILSDEITALTAVFIFTFFPVNIFVGRSALHEASLMFFTIAAVYYFMRWTREEKIDLAILANLFFILAVAIKKTNLYLFLPLGYLAFSKWKRKALRKSWLVFFAFLIILAWQAWEWHLRMRFPDPQWIHFNLQHHIERIIYTYTSADFYKKAYDDILNYVLTPLGLVFFLIGLTLKIRNREGRVLYFWLAAVAFFYLVMPEQFWAHAYYHVHYLPIAAFLIARGFIFFINMLQASQNLVASHKKIIVLFFGALFFLMSMRYSLGYYRVPETKRPVLSAAEHVKNIVPKDSLVVSTVDNPASLLYYSERKGWTFNCCTQTPQERILELNDLRKQGAGYLAAAYKAELRDNTVFWNYLRNNYDVAYEDDNSVIFDIREKKINDKR